MDLQELIARVEAATSADREIDLALACIAFNEPEEQFLTDELERREFGHQQRYTESLDSALALVERVLPGATVLFGMRQTPDTLPWARVGPWHTADATAPTPALALILAMLRALPTEAKTNGE